jgi:hypothetical protein
MRRIKSAQRQLRRPGTVSAVGGMTASVGDLPKVRLTGATRSGEPGGRAPSPWNHRGRRRHRARCRTRRSQEMKDAEGTIWNIRPSRVPELPVRRAVRPVWWSLTDTRYPYIVNE